MFVFNLPLEPFRLHTERDVRPWRPLKTDQTRRKKHNEVRFIKPPPPPLPPVLKLRGGSYRINQYLDIGMNNFTEQSLCNATYVI